MFADHEVAGEGRPADVQATSPVGSHRMATGVPVGWVTDHERPWIGAVPSIRLSVPTEPGGHPASIGGRGVIAIGAGQGFNLATA